MFVGSHPLLMGAAAGAAGLRPQDVFATSAYTANGAPLTINNGLDLAGQGGLVWEKCRSAAGSHYLTDTARGAGNLLDTDTTNAEVIGSATAVSAFYSNGYKTPNWQAGPTYVSWALRKAPKFFDIVTYTGNGATTRALPHNLGIKPGFYFIEGRSAGTYPEAYHNAIGAGNRLQINLTDAMAADSTGIAPVEPTATTLTVGSRYNSNSATYVVFLWAHDPSGIIQCGAGNVTLPWPPQWVLCKDAGAANNWQIIDSVRGFTKVLNPNLSAAENTAGGVTVSGSTISFSGMATPVWCAISSPV